MDKRIILGIIAIIVVLVVAFLSQQAYLKGTGNTLISGAADQAGAYLSKGSDWVKSNVASKIGGEVTKRGEAIKNEINQEKQKVSENILDKTKNYFTGITDSILHPGTPQNCPAVQPLSN